MRGIRKVAAERQSLRNWFIPLAAAGACVAVASTLTAAEPAWKTGSALRKELQTPLSLTWQDRAARDALASLAAGTDVAIWLDRRIDPDQRLHLQTRDEPLQAVLLRASEQLRAGVSLVGSVVYIGPKDTAGKLATLAALRRQEVQPLPNATKSRLLRSQAWRWDELAEPRALLAELASQGGVRVQNVEVVPHDLFPAASWPAMPWTERMTMLLAGFGLTFELADGGLAIRLLPLPERLTIERTYTPRGDARDVAAQLKRLAPDAKIVVEGSRLVIVASVEDHDRISRLLKGERVQTTVVTPGEKRYTLTALNQPAGAIVKSVAGQLGKELKYDAALAEKLRTKVSLTVKDVPLEELLGKTLRPLGLSYKLTDAALEVVALE